MIQRSADSTTRTVGAGRRSRRRSLDKGRQSLMKVVQDGRAAGLIPEVEQGMAQTLKIAGQVRVNG